MGEATAVRTRHVRSPLPHGEVVLQRDAPLTHADITVEGMEAMGIVPHSVF